MLFRISNIKTTAESSSQKTNFLKTGIKAYYTQSLGGFIAS